MPTFTELYGILGIRYNLLCTDRKKLKIRCKSKEKELVIYPAIWSKTSLSQVDFFANK